MKGTRFRVRFSGGSQPHNSDVQPKHLSPVLGAQRLEKNRKRHEVPCSLGRSGRSLACRSSSLMALRAKAPSDGSQRGHRGRGWASAAREAGTLRFGFAVESVGGTGLPSWVVGPRSSGKLGSGLGIEVMLAEEVAFHEITTDNPRRCKTITCTKGFLGPRCHHGHDAFCKYTKTTYQTSTLHATHQMQTHTHWVFNIARCRSENILYMCMQASSGSVVRREMKAV